MKHISLLICLIIVSVHSFATIRNVPANFTSIQIALNSCAIGDTVLVAPGIYNENIIWPNIADIKLLSTGDSSNTIIDGNQNGHVIKFDSLANIGFNTLINGFTIANGLVKNSGAGILVNIVPVTFDAVQILNNVSLGPNNVYGAGISFINSSSTIKNSSILYNSTDSVSFVIGAGLYSRDGDVLIENCDISHNTVNSDSWGYGGGVGNDYGIMTIRNSKIDSNFIDSDSWARGNALYTRESKTVLENVEITNNRSDTNSTIHYTSGALYFRSPINSSLTNVLMHSNGPIELPGWPGFSAIEIQDPIRNKDTIKFTNCTIADNNTKLMISSRGGAIDCWQGCDSLAIVVQNSVVRNPLSATEIVSDGPIVAEYSNIYKGFTGIGNMNSNPYFISNTDYHLSQFSPNINAGTLLGAPTFDLDNNPRPLPVGSMPDIGCYETSNLFQVGIPIVKKNVFKIFPNPTDKKIRIECIADKQKLTNVTIHNNLGVSVMRYSKSNIPNQKVLDINLSQLSPGIYYVEVFSNLEKGTYKILKQ